MVPQLQVATHSPHGLSLPLRMGIGEGVARCSSEGEHIRNAIRLIIATRPGTRPLVPQFGCRIHELLFKPATPALKAAMRFFVTQSLNIWEPRIDLTDVRIEPADSGRLRLDVRYTIKGTRRSEILGFALHDGRISMALSDSARDRNR